MERPKAFLMPVSDYEVIEVKETKVALKNVSHERNIKIGGGRETPSRHREPLQEPPLPVEEEEPIAMEGSNVETASGARMDKRRDRRRRRHRREDQDWGEHKTKQKEEEKPSESEQRMQGGSMEDETFVSSSMFSSLIPPPPTLISQTLSRYKDKEFMEAPSKKVEEERDAKNKSEEDEKPGYESTPLNRVASERVEVSTFSSIPFSSLPRGNDSHLV